MNDAERQRMNLRTIRVTLASALRTTTSEQAERCRARAQQLLQQARDQASDPAVVGEIDALMNSIGSEARSRPEAEA